MTSPANGPADTAARADTTRAASAGVANPGDPDPGDSSPGHADSGHANSGGTDPGVRQRLRALLPRPGRQASRPKTIDLTTGADPSTDPPALAQAAGRTTRPARRDDVHRTLTAALARYGGESAPWADAWIAWIQRHSRLTPAKVAELAPPAAAVIDRLFLYIEPTEWTGGADLATSVGLAADALDRGTNLHALVLEAIRLAKETNRPTTEDERQRLWRSCGVLPETVSQTVLCWALPIGADVPWARGLRARDDAGVPTHLTRLDLARFPDPLVRADSVIAVCENARVLEATVAAGIKHPMICLGGAPNPVAAAVLRALAVSGARIAYHGDFDREGLEITRAVLATAGSAATAWRMGASDYRDAVATTTVAGGIPPATFGPRVPATPWDPELAAAIGQLGYVIEQERVLSVLLADLAAGTLLT